MNSASIIFCCFASKKTINLSKLYAGIVQDLSELIFSAFTGKQRTENMMIYALFSFLFSELKLNGS